MSISIIGNLIFDRLYIHSKKLLENQSNEYSSYIESAGASGNVIRALKKIKKIPSIKIIGNVGDDDEGRLVKKILKSYKVNIKNIITIKNQRTSSALILANKGSSSTTSLVSWGACTQTKFPLNNLSQWNHFMYLDKLKNINDTQLKLCKNLINSADLVSSDLSQFNKNRIYKCLKYIDFLILSEVEAMSFKKDHVSNLSKFIGTKTRQFCIIHTPKKYYVSDGKNVVSIKNTKLIKNIIVLGAGDSFAAAFISEAIKMKNRVFNINDVINIVKIASNITFRLLEKNNYE